MSDAHPAPSESARFVAAMKQILTVSKPEILRREAEAKKRRQEQRRQK